MSYTTYGNYNRTLRVEQPNRQRRQKDVVTEDPLDHPDHRTSGPPGPADPLDLPVWT